MLQPRVTDLSHHNTVEDLSAAATAGIWGVINKATQGTTYRDPSYAQRRQQVLDAGMLWAAYHFSDSSDPVQQVEFFLDYAKPDESTMLCLDYEDHPSGRARTMRPDQMVAFLREIERRTGRLATLYGGNRIKEDIGRLSPTDRDYVCSHPLWLCQYGSHPSLPQGFDRSFLWQYTDGRVGPEPHGVPGISGEVDLNMFNGTRDELEAAWRGPSATAPSRRGTVPDSKPARGSDDVDVPPFLRPPAGGPNVHVPSARYSVEVEVVQRELDAMGYHEVGDVDGLWGGKTAAGIKAFFIDRGLDDAAQMGPVLNNEIAKAKKAGWSRPIAPSRANAAPKDIAPRVETVRVSLWSKFLAQITAGAAALGIGGSTVSQVYSSAQGVLSPVHDVLKSVPPEAWLAIIGLSAVLVWYATSRAAKAATKDYNTGRLN